MRQIEIADLNWKFRQEGKSEWYRASVPGCVHTDLYGNQLIPDPFFGLNEKGLQWIEKENWIYQSEFTTPPGWIDNPAELLFEGLDTFARVYLNGVCISQSENMFLPCRIIIPGGSLKRQNILEIHFKSPYLEGLKELKKLSYSLPANNDEGEEKVSPWLRKAPYMFGWDWGPRLLTSGIWKNGHIRSITAGIIQDCGFITSLDKNGNGLIRVRYEIFSGRISHEYKLIFKIQNKKEKEIRFRTEKEVSGGEFTLTIKAPDLWWPRNHGSQTLYDLSLELWNEDELIDKADRKTGFRKIELVREKDHQGTGFKFRINGRDIFIKGTNLIPLDYFVSGLQEEHYSELMENVLAVNINMLRNWGGGIYEDDRFYELCDRLGIMVWQDFMFACSMYPSDEHFLENIRKEISYQVKRLSHHPSISVWCGNNEILEGFHNWGWKEILGENADNAFKSYEKIFYSLIPSLLEEFSSGIPYWPSSPSSDEKSLLNLNSGDFHYWDLVKDIQPYTVYSKNVGRFMSEFGFKSYPDARCFEYFLPEKERYILSESMEEHQGWPKGAELVEKNLQWFYPEAADLFRFSYLSQLLQADAISWAIESHRMNKPACMGTMYWQFNDCWPSATWSGIDYYGNWKALQYSLVQNYSDEFLACRIDEHTLKVSIVNDRKECAELEVSIKILDFSGRILFAESGKFLASTQNSMEIMFINLKDIAAVNSLRDCLIHAMIREGEKLCFSKNFFFTPNKDLRLPDPLIRLSVLQQKTFDILYLKAENFARGVYLFHERPDGFFSDNFFDLLPGQAKSIIFRPKEGDNKYKRNFSFITLYDCMNPKLHNP